jgi:hypothetical protein
MGTKCSGLIGLAWAPKPHIFWSHSLSWAVWDFVSLVVAAFICCMDHYLLWITSLHLPWLQKQNFNLSLHLKYPEMRGLFDQIWTYLNQKVRYKLYKSHQKTKKLLAPSANSSADSSMASAVKLQLQCRYGRNIAQISTNTICEYQYNMNIFIYIRLYIYHIYIHWYMIYIACMSLYNYFHTYIHTIPYHTITLHYITLHYIQ